MKAAVVAVAKAGKSAMGTQPGIDGSKARIDDVANLAGVSIKTVSRVLNDEPNVSAATKRKVLAAIQGLHYSPCLEARRLAESKNQSGPRSATGVRGNPSVAPPAAVGDSNDGRGSRLHADLLQLADLRRRRLISDSEFELRITRLLARQV